MKRIIALLLVIVMTLCGCSGDNNAEGTSKTLNIPLESNIETPSNVSTIIPDEDNVEPLNDNTQEVVFQKSDISREEYAKTLSFDGLSDENLQRYVKDNIYDELLKELDSEEYFIGNIETQYVSKEYIQELEANSKANIFFGYTLAELEEQFQGKRYIFTLGEDGKTTVVPFEGYDDMFTKVMKNVAIGTGVILICVTVSAVTAGAGAPAVSLIFATSAKTATTMAVSSGVISGLAAGAIEGVKTGDMSKAFNAGALAGSEGFMWGAITGAIAGGVSETIALKGAATNGLTMNQVALIQKESGYPLSVIKQFHTMDEYNAFKNVGLQSDIVGGRLNLVRKDIDLYNVLDDKGRNNYTRLSKGLNPIDSAGNTMEWHHIGQQNDATLALLTTAEHDNKVLHGFEEFSKIDRKAFDKYKRDILNKDLLRWLLS